jgi:hypothetical protein
LNRFAAVERLERSSLIEIAHCLVTGPLGGIARLSTGRSGDFTGSLGGIARLIISPMRTFERLPSAAWQRLAPPPSEEDKQSKGSHHKNTDEQYVRGLMHRILRKLLLERRRAYH